MSIIGICVAAFQFYLYSVNRREYYKLLDEYDDMRKPMMNTTMSMSTINSKGSHGGHLINFGQTPSRYPMRIMNQQQSIEEENNRVQEPMNQYPTPLQNVQNLSGRFARPGRAVVNYNTPSDRVQITEEQYDQNQN